jgi:hypothetical protein
MTYLSIIYIIYTNELRDFSRETRFQNITLLFEPIRSFYYMINPMINYTFHKSHSDVGYEM